MNIRVIAFLSVMTLLLAAAFVIPVKGQSNPQNPGGPVPVSSGPISLMSAAETYAYWTPARMAEANANTNMPGLTMAAGVMPDGPSQNLLPPDPFAMGPGQFIPGNPPSQP